MALRQTALMLNLCHSLDNTHMVLQASISMYCIFSQVRHCVQR